MHNAHSKRLPPSGADRWTKCPAATLPLPWYMGGDDTSSPAAEEGTRAHEILAELLGVDPIAEGVGWPPKPGDIKSRYPDADDEMCRVLAQEVNDMLNLTSPTPDWQVIEGRLHFADHPEAWGTVDYASYRSYADRIVVRDFKYGKHHPVSAEGNLQLLCYAMGVVRYLYAEGWDLSPAETTVEIQISQPRSLHGETFTSTECKLKALENLFARTVQPALDKIALVDALGNAQSHAIAGDHCGYCPRKALCPALADQMFGTISEIEEAGDPETLPLDKAAKLLDKGKAMSDFMSALGSRLLAAAQNGQEVPGYKLVQNPGRRVWVDDAEMLLSAAYGDLVYERKLRSPPQLEKEEGISKEVVANLIARTPGSTSLAPVSDRRKTVHVEKDPTKMFDI